MNIALHVNPWEKNYFSLVWLVFCNKNLKSSFNCFLLILCGIEMFRSFIIFVIVSVFP